jgi:hypothetical protein
MRIVQFIVSFCLFIGVAVTGLDHIQRAHRLQVTKAQYSEVNNFGHGLFSIDTWKDQLTDIVSDEIDDLSFKGKTAATLRPALEKQLTILIDKVAARIKKQNWKTTQGWLKQSFIDSFVDVNEIKKGVPEYADAMMKELASPHTEKKLKSLLSRKVDEYMNETFDKQDDSLRTALVAKYGHGNEEVASEKLEKKLDRGHDRELEESLWMIAMSVLIFAVLGFSKKPLAPWEYFILLGTLIVLMVTGISTPMIDMEAKISELSFVLMDHPIVFKDQVLFFQSKSILDVFHIMITHKQLQMKLVGVLLVTFSVIFPMFKMLSTLVYYYDFCEARKRWLVKFFVFHSGKWSMADVLVVAIFMAYIGFNGIINSQLENIKEAGQGSLNILTTNGTHLQPGYFVFLTFAILALFLSLFLKNRSYVCPPKDPDV